MLVLMHKFNLVLMHKFMDYIEKYLYCIIGYI